MQIKQEALEDLQATLDTVFLKDISDRGRSREERIKLYKKNSVYLREDYQKVREGIRNNMEVLERKGQTEHRYYKAQQSALELLASIEAHHFEVAYKLYNILNE